VGSSPISSTTQPQVRSTSGSGISTRIADVKRVEKADAQADLDALITLRAQAQAPDAPKQRLASLAEVIEAWFADGFPNVAPSRTSRHARVKSPNTIANAGQLLGTSVIPVIG
jgi:hypothetical protein